MGSAKFCTNYLPSKITSYTVFEVSSQATLVIVRPTWLAQILHSNIVNGQIYCWIFFPDSFENMGYNVPKIAVGNWNGNWYINDMLSGNGFWL